MSMGTEMSVKVSFVLGLALLFMIQVISVSDVLGGEMKGLRVSENGRFLVREDGSAFFPLADTAWELPWRLNRSEVETYLERRKRQGFNTIGIVAFCGEEGGHTNRHGAKPFEMSGRRYDPLRPIETRGGSPEDPGEHDYWDHLDYVVNSAESMGMYIVLLPTWGNCVAGDWGNGRNRSSEIIFDSTSAYGYGCWIGKRFKARKNIIWMLGGDRNAVYGKKDYRPVFRAMARGVKYGLNTVGGQDAISEPSTALMSYHPRKWMPNSSEWFHQDPWLDFNSIQDQPKDQIDAIRLDYHLSPAKPTWLFEGGYEHRRSSYIDWHIRYQSYQTVFAGGCGVTYGNMNIYNFSGSLGSPDEPQARAVQRQWENSLDDPGGMQMQHLLKLMMSLTNDQFLDRIPDQALIDGDTGAMEGGEGMRSNRLQATRGRQGDYALIYSANGRSIRVMMNRLAGPLMNAFWFNPRNGKWWSKGRDTESQVPSMAKIPSGPEVPVCEFDPPGKPRDGNDVVLVLQLVE